MTTELYDLMIEKRITTILGDKISSTQKTIATRTTLINSHEVAQGKKSNENQLQSFRLDAHTHLYQFLSNAEASPLKTSLYFNDNVITVGAGPAG
ncbi:hypothetical protein QE152_g17004 [Popillia japonica]|uniref:Uncharacterized protein n=1 Tax=Popillia japonica TaxID=7064 RepID=A0AAW1L295_POPJA